MAGLRWGGPFNDEPEDNEEIEQAREEIEDLLDQAERDPFVALDREIEDNPLYPEYEDEVQDARFNAYAMMDDLDTWEAEESSDDGGGPFDD